MSSENIIQMPDSSFARMQEAPGEFHVQVRVTGLPATLSETGDQLFTIEEAIGHLTARRDMLKQHGINIITKDLPKKKVKVYKDGKVIGEVEKAVGEAKQDGIRYLGYERNDVSWSTVCKQIIDELVPKTKAAEAENIINSLTHENVIQKLEQVDA